MTVIIGALSSRNYTISSKLVDHWSGALADTNFIPSLVSGGDNLSLQGGGALNGTAGYATLDGAAQRLEAATAGRHDIDSGGSIIVAMRTTFEATAASVYGYIAGEGISAGNKGYRFYLQLAGLATYSAGSDITDNKTSALLPNPLDDGSLHHTVLAFSFGEYRRLYTDGVFDSEETTNVADAAPATPSTFTVGALFGGSGTTEAGMHLYDLQVYKAAGTLPSNIAQISKWLATHPGQALPSGLW